MDRFINHIYARLFGYFWLPCPKCGKMFGGHEVHEPVFPALGLNLTTCCFPYWMRIPKERLK